MSMIAFVHPGQGSQQPGMGLELLELEPRLCSTYYDAADELLGVPLARLCHDGPASALAPMPVTQPAVFLTSVLAAAVLEHRGIRPDAVAGHSVGEFAAAVTAGSLDWTDGLRLVRARGELMAAVHRQVDGKMGAVIGLSERQVEQLCAAARQGTGDVVEIANHNDHAQFVVAGHRAAVDHVLAAADDAGADRVLTLRVSGPAHCSLLAGIGEDLATAVAAVELRDPVVPLYSSTTGGRVHTGAEVRDSLRRQLTQRVRWVDTVASLSAAGADTFVEVGPGKALSNICGRLRPGAAVFRTGEARHLGRTLGALAPSRSA
jgi:[acyl-carrier-protein] S-malonyltransferase